jgi:surface antigen
MRASSRWCAVVFALASMLGHAASRSFYQGLPISHMTDEDYAIAMKVIDAALDEGAEGTTYRWENRATGASGTITPRKSFSRNGMSCRDARIEAAAGGQRNDSAWTLCKTAQGWKVLE